MIIFSAFFEALESLTANKLRSGLTILGIVIGVAAVIAMISVGRGAQNTIAGSIQGMAGAGTVEVRVYLVSAATSFQALESHYHGFLDAGWQAQETPALAAARAQGQVGVLWSNEGTGEILSLQYMQAPAYGGNLLIVLYASKEGA